ncbi:hypothetical protein H681_23110 [Pseudomonas sp. ATCC 13867]|nr:hypothetical protein H681_23110 [Pseudomonas sp. ATCC 13867]
MEIHDAGAIADVLREIHTQIIRIADGVQRLAELLDEPGQRRCIASRFLSEEQFAKLLGTSVASLRTRRFRKQIPESIWVKDGRRTLYSVEAYEQWVQTQLQSRLNSVPSQQQKTRRGKRLAKPSSVKRPFPLLV